MSDEKNDNGKVGQVIALRPDRVALSHQFGGYVFSTRCGDSYATSVTIDLATTNAIAASLRSGKALLYEYVERNVCVCKIGVTDMGSGRRRLSIAFPSWTKGDHIGVAMPAGMAKRLADAIEQGKMFIEECEDRQ